MQVDACHDDGTGDGGSEPSGGRKEGSAVRGQLYDPASMTWRCVDTRTADDRIESILAPLAPVGGSGPGDALHAHGLSLRAWMPADLADFRALLDDPQVWQYLPEPYPDPFNDATARTLIIAANTMPGSIVRAVLQAGRPIGQLRLQWLADQPRREAEISYWLGRAHWGKGLGSTLVAGAMARAFHNDPALLRLTARVHPDNPASARLLQKAGFRELAAPPEGHEGSAWRWFALRRQHRP